MCNAMPHPSNCVRTLNTVAAEMQCQLGGVGSSFHSCEGPKILALGEKPHMLAEGVKRSRQVIHPSLMDRFSDGRSWSAVAGHRFGCLVFWMGDHGRSWSTGSVLRKQPHTQKIQSGVEPPHSKKVPANQPVHPRATDP